MVKVIWFYFFFRLCTNTNCVYSVLCISVGISFYYVPTCYIQLVSYIYLTSTVPSCSDIRKQYIWWQHSSRFACLQQTYNWGLKLACRRQQNWFSCEMRVPCLCFFPSGADRCPVQLPTRIGFRFLCIHLQIYISSYALEFTANQSEYYFEIESDSTNALLATK